MRCRGRLSNAPIPYDSKFPIILSSKSNFTKLVVNECHLSVGHNLCRDTLTQVRTKYWIPKGRQFVKKVLRECIICRRFESKPLSYPSPPDLPEYRLRDTHAFDAIGIDYAGPVYVKNIYGQSKEMHKAWIGLITCASSRAVYLDLVSDSSSTECILLLKRFISRYGAPSNITSDNGKCFVSAETQDFATSRNIMWKFNLESAPWQGGFFERLVKSVKRCLKKILINARLNFLEMLTLLTKIELIINNRPLTYIYDDVEELPLTPNNLIYGRLLNQVVNDTKDTQDELTFENLTERVDNVNRILLHFWKRWKAEYVVDLREHHKLKKGCSDDCELSVNDIVLVVNDKQPRYLWRIGRIQELIKGRDDKVRGAKVLTKTDQGHFSTLRRPINQLILLELNKHTSELANVEKAIGIPKVTFIDEANIETNI